MAPGPPAEIMATFTCLSCHVAFASADGQRDHFRSDWHRYNLMRKVAELPPVSRDAYNERVGQVPTQTIQLTFQTAAEKIPCRTCKKTFANQHAYDNHIQSKKHMEVVVAEGTRNKKNRQKAKAAAAATMATEEEEDDEDMEVEDVDSDEWEGEAILLLDCLFCNHHSDSLEDELLHLTEKHSFFIPDLEFCTDVPGLLTYLGEKVGCGFECLGCQWTARRSPTLDSIRKHMNDKQHNMLVLEGDCLLEYTDFYDYSSSYPDAGEGMSNGEDVQQTVLSGEGLELVLPSGTTIGHRSLSRYYRQKLDPSRMAVMVKKSPGQAMHSVLAQYRSLGWIGATRADLVRRHKDIQYWTRVRNKYNTRLSTKANKLFVSKGSGIML